jgi:hypothetical protein
METCVPTTKISTHCVYFTRSYTKGLFIFKPLNYLNSRNLSTNHFMIYLFFSGMPVQISALQWSDLWNASKQTRTGPINFKNVSLNSIYYNIIQYNYTNSINIFLTKYRKHTLWISFNLSIVDKRFPLQE